MLERLFERNWVVVSSDEPALPGGILVLPDREYIYWVPDECDFAYPQSVRRAYLLSPRPDREEYAIFEILDSTISIPTAGLPEVVKQIARDYYYPASLAFARYWSRGSVYPCVFLGEGESEGKMDMWMPHCSYWEEKGVKPTPLWLDGVFAWVDTFVKGMKFAVWFDATEKGIRKAIPEILSVYPHTVFVFWGKCYHFRRGFFDFLYSLEGGYI